MPLIIFCHNDESLPLILEDDMRNLLKICGFRSWLISLLFLLLLSISLALNPSSLLIPLSLLSITVSFHSTIFSYNLFLNIAELLLVLWLFFKWLLLLGWDGVEKRTMDQTEELIYLGFTYRDWLDFPEVSVRQNFHQLLVLLLFLLLLQLVLLSLGNLRHHCCLFGGGFLLITGMSTMIPKVNSLLSLAPSTSTSSCCSQYSQ